MMKMKVQMDEKKIEKSGIYSIEQINNMVIEAAKRKGITKRDEKGLFIGNDDDKDFSNFGRIVLYFIDQEWFLPLVKTWVLYEDDDENDLKTYFIQYLKKNEKVGRA